MSIPSIIPPTTPNLEIGKDDEASPLGPSRRPPEQLPDSDPLPDDDHPADGSDEADTDNLDELGP